MFEGRPDAAHVLALALGTGPGVKEEEEEEVLNPLEMEMDDEELMVRFESLERNADGSPNEKKRLPRKQSPLPSSNCRHQNR